MFSHSVIVLGGRGQPAAAAAGTSEEAHTKYSGEIRQKDAGSSIS